MFVSPEVTRHVLEPDPVCLILLQKTKPNNTKARQWRTSRRLLPLRYHYVVKKKTDTAFLRAPRHGSPDPLLLLLLLSESPAVLLHSHLVEEEQDSPGVRSMKKKRLLLLSVSQARRLSPLSLHLLLPVLPLLQEKTSRLSEG